MKNILLVSWSVALICVFCLSWKVIEVKKDLSYYKQELKRVIETKDMVIGVKYIQSGNGNLRAYWYQLPINGSFQIDFYKPPFDVKIIRVGFYRNMSGMKDAPIEKETPWDSLSLQDKMFLCAYGSSGNKMNKKDFEKIKTLYGGE